MAKSSIHFKQMQVGAMAHNDRSLRDPSYLLPTKFRNENEISRSSAEAETFVKELFNQASINYKNHFKQKIQSKSYMWEAVVNLNPQHTMEDLEKLVKELELETGFTGIQIAIHNDEGHIKTDKDGKEFAIKNHHAHITFFTLDRSTGQQLYRRRITEKQKMAQPTLKPFNIMRLKKIQTIVANTLKMERGEEGSNKTRMEHKQYRAMQKQLEKERKILIKKINKHYLPKIKDLKKENAELREELQDLPKIKDLKTENAKLREELQEQGAGREDYARLEEVVKNLKTEIKNKKITMNEMNIELNIFRNSFKKETEKETEKDLENKLGKALHIINFYNPELELNLSRIDRCYDFVLNQARKKKYRKKTNILRN